MLRKFELLPYGEDEANLIGRLLAELDRKGAPIGFCDTAIAGLCIANGAAIVTRNVKHFSRFPGLAIIEY